MSQEIYQGSTIPEQEGTSDFKKLFFKVLRNWYYVLVSVILALAIAYLINRYTPSVYVVSTSILIKAPKDNSVSGLLYGNEVFKSSSNLENEAVLLKRYNLIERTLRDLDFSISYLREGNVRVTDIYPDKPIQVFIDSASNIIPYYVEIKCSIKNNNEYSLKTENEIWNTYFSDQVYLFDKKYNINGFQFIITRDNAAVLQNSNSEIIFRVNDLENLANSYIGRLNVAPLPRTTSILSVSIQGTNPFKEVVFLNRLSENYISTGLEEKNINASRTIEFIEQQLTDIRDSLNQIENRIQNFKTANSSVNLSVEGSRLYSSIQDLEREKAGLLVKQKYLDYLTNYLNEEDTLGQVIIPSALGIQDQVLNSLIEKLVSLQLEIKMVKVNENQPNPISKYNRQRVDEIIRNIRENLNNIERANTIAINDLDARTQRLTSEIQKLPGAEREFINIQRMYTLSETLYLFLMEKRAEASISKAANTADYRVVNEARLKGVGGPIQPKITQNYLFAFALGLGFPIMVLFLLDYFNNKVRSQEDLINLTKIPFLGMIGHSPVEEDLIIHQNPKSVISESFRTVRSNLRYLSENKNDCRTYLITSSVSGEGKTFCAKNLAYIFALSEKKTLLVNSDMRKKNSYKEFGVNSSIGLSNYLAGLATKEDIMNQSNNENLSIITSGDIPPNPSELLLNERTSELLESLKNEFDYIFLDTPPIGILSDGLELMKYSDVNIFLIREDFTFKSYVSSLNHMYLTGKVKNVALLYNDVDLNKLSYGYGYGYGYGAYGGYGQENVKKNVFQKIFKL